MEYNECKRMTVWAMGIDRDGNLEAARNGNTGECTEEVGKCGCTHAEIALLDKLPNLVSVTVSHAPCLYCAIALVKAGVKYVGYLKAYRLSAGTEYLLANGVKLYHIGG